MGYARTRREWSIDPDKMTVQDLYAFYNRYRRNPKIDKGLLSREFINKKIRVKTSDKFISRQESGQSKAMMQGTIKAYENDLPRGIMNYKNALTSDMRQRTNYFKDIRKLGTF